MNSEWFQIDTGSWNCNRLGAFLFSGDDVKNQSACCLVGRKLVYFWLNCLWKQQLPDSGWADQHLDIDSKKCWKCFDWLWWYSSLSAMTVTLSIVATHVLESENGSTLPWEITTTMLIKSRNDSNWETSTSNQQKKQAQLRLSGSKRKSKKLQTHATNWKSRSWNWRIRKSKPAISEQMLKQTMLKKLMELQAELDKISHRQEEAMLEWEELSEQV